MSSRENALQNVAKFRQKLAQALKDLPRCERELLLEQIDSHLAEAISALSTGAEIGVVLEALGSPEAIAAAAGLAPSGSPQDQYGRGDIRHLTWVVLGLLVVLATSYTFWTALGVAFQAAFFAVSVVATLLGRPREAAPLFLIGAYGWRSGILLWDLLQELALPPHWPLPMLAWPSLSFYVPSLLGFVVGLLWLILLTKTPWRPWLRGNRTAPTRRAANT